VAKAPETLYNEEKRRILVVDDEEKNRAFLASVLEKEYEVFYAVDGEDALAQLQKYGTTFSLVLLDLNMPKVGGLDVLAVMHSSDELKDLPVIMTTSDNSAEEDCLRLGANDFIPKPYPYSGVILARVLRLIELFEKRNIVQSTQRDALTGLYSRDYFFWEVGQHDQHHPDMPMDAIFIDITGFHIINERFGMNTGNTIIRHLASRLRSLSIEHSGLVCRSIADSFIFYCPHIEDLRAFYDEIVDGLEPHERDFVHIRIGVYPNVKKDTEILPRFDQAKVAADTVRHTRNNAIGVYDEVMHNKQRYCERLLDDFSDAIQKKQFVVYYQPKYDIRFSTPELFSAEALVRWQHPVFGLIGPVDFIPLLENNGLIYTLDRYVWERAAEQIKMWKERFGATLPISVNMSRIDLFEPDVTDVLIGIIQKYSLAPTDLLVEITESAYAQDHELIEKTANKLREKGFRIEMDDFGTGYSSLSMLSSLPIDALKLDMNLVQNAFEKSGDTRMLEIIVDIADYLSIPVIAEGVETLNQLNVLKAIGCDYVQGYYFSKPVLPEAFELYMQAYVEKKEDSRHDEGGDYTTAKKRNLSFMKVASALFSGYESIVHVDMKTGQFIEYRQSESRRKLRHENTGMNFFTDILDLTKDILPAEEYENLCELLTHKEEILLQLKQKPFSMFYRLIEDGKPVWHFLRAILSKNGENLVFGILSVDDAFSKLPVKH